jgi:hypothetical protein
VRKIKTLIDSCPHFARQAKAYDHLIELHTSSSRFKRGEKFIKYKQMRWYVYTQEESPHFYGSYDNVMRAVFYALK